MIIYRHRELAGTHADVPAELAGFRNVADDVAVCHGYDNEGHVVGLCSPILWQHPAAGTTWTPIADGWEIASDGRPFDPMSHIRATCFCKVVLVQDAHGRYWAAPMVLTRDGARSFPVAYGPGFKPALTPDQDQAVRVATELRGLLAAATGEHGTGSIDSDALMPMVAWALTLTHHLSVETIGQQCLLDELLAQRVAAVMAGSEA